MIGRFRVQRSRAAGADVDHAAIRTPRHVINGISAISFVGREVVRGGNVKVRKVTAALTKLRRFGEILTVSHHAYVCRWKCLSALKFFIGLHAFVDNYESHVAYIFIPKNLVPLVNTQKRSRPRHATGKNSFKQISRNVHTRSFYFFVTLVEKHKGWVRNVVTVPLTMCGRFTCCKCLASFPKTNLHKMW